MKKLWFVVEPHDSGEARNAALFFTEPEAIAYATTRANDSPGIAHHIAVTTAVALAAINSAKIKTISEA